MTNSDETLEDRLPDHKIPFREDGSIIKMVEGSRIVLPTPSKLAELLGTNVAEHDNIIGYVGSFDMGDREFLNLLSGRCIDLMEKRTNFFDLSREDVPRVPLLKDFMIGGKEYHLHFVGQEYGGVTSLTVKDETYITKQKRIAEERQRALEALAAVGASSAELIHDIRNVLVTMNVGIKLLNMEIDGSKLKYGDALESIGEQLERLEKLVNSPLDFLRIGGYMLAPVRVNHFLSEASLYLKSLGPESVKINLDAIGNGREFYVNLNRSMFSDKILRNIAQNSVDAGATEITLSYNVKEAYLVLKIRDNGTAEIPEEVYQHMLEPRITGKVHGTGWGLATVKKHVEIHKGQIRYYRNDEIERGASGFSFEIYLPLTKAPDDKGMPNGRILIG